MVEAGVQRMILTAKPNACVPQSTAKGKVNGLLMDDVAAAWTETLEY
jgi:hypothetical protein